MRPKGGKYLKGMPHVSDAEYLCLFMADVNVTATGCWEYTKGFEHRFKVDNGTPGYRTVSYRGKSWRIHRLFWVLENKCPIPKDMVILHTCDNPPCCNPKHLKLGTRADNNRDMKAKGRYNYHRSHYTHCRNGHEFSPENTRFTKQGARACKTCQRAHTRRAAGWPAHLLNLPPQPKGSRLAFSGVKHE